MDVAAAVVIDWDLAVRHRHFDLANIASNTKTRR